MQPVVRAPHGRTGGLRTKATHKQNGDRRSEIPPQGPHGHLLPATHLSALVTKGHRSTQVGIFMARSSSGSRRRLPLRSRRSNLFDRNRKNSFFETMPSLSL